MDASTPLASRDAQIAGFIAAAGWGHAKRAPLAGDASARRYERLSLAGRGTSVLMDADPARGEDVVPFRDVASLLREYGLSAPGILAEDTAAGLLLLEDLGDDLYARRVRQGPVCEREIYAAAIDLLVTLHTRAPDPALPQYGPADMAPLAALATVWYRPGALGTPRAAGLEARLTATCRDALLAQAEDADVMVLRDYHAENLVWLPHRSGLARVGLLDFQDAAAGHRGYDLISLLRDARRDVSADMRADMLARYAKGTGRDLASLTAACAVLGAQRNLRILGVFARLSLRDGKPAYIDLIPRVWAHIEETLAHPACAALRAVVSESLPVPTPDVLNRLRAASS
ncbi:MAG: phosphotransferase [Pseudomonadota bacterium]